jgi:hypothetical protein
MALLDSQLRSPAGGRVAAETPGLKMLWVGDRCPAQVWRSFQRPFAWPEVIAAMDDLFQPAPLDLDLGRRGPGAQTGRRPSWR